MLKSKALPGSPSNWVSFQILVTTILVTLKGGSALEKACKAVL